MNYVRANGIDFAYLEQGSGPSSLRPEAMVSKAHNAIAVRWAWKPERQSAVT